MGFQDARPECGRHFTFQKNLLSLTKDGRESQPFLKFNSSQPEKFYEYQRLKIIFIFNFSLSNKLINTGPFFIYKTDHYILMDTLNLYAEPIYRL